ncbi:MAG: hypothetical protein HY744_09060, partial [Deltaproteobacteria bacterium]|nr:hypothetical protein [Deltaproteobacteria bacterium]
MNDTRHELLDRTLDIVFKMLFASPDAHQPLCSLLSAVLCPATPIAQATVLNPELPREGWDELGAVLDI